MKVAMQGYIFPASIVMCTYQTMELLNKEYGWYIEFQDSKVSIFLSCFCEFVLILGKGEEKKDSVTPRSGCKQFKQLFIQTMLTIIVEILLKIYRGV